jgi:hypothetical protein
MDFRQRFGRTWSSTCTATASRPQRGRRAGVHPAGDVRRHRKRKPSCARPTSTAARARRLTRERGSTPSRCGAASSARGGASPRPSEGFARSGPMGGRLGGLRGGPTRGARGGDGSPEAQRCGADRRRSATGARGLHAPPQDRDAPLEPPRDGGAAAPAPLDWGRRPRRSPSPACWRGHAVRLSGQDAGAAPSATATRCCTTPDGASAPPLTSSPGPRPRFEVIDSPSPRRGAGLRLRLQPRLPRRPRDLGGAVRRLRQRRAGHHRPVHRELGGQVEPPERASCCCCPTASRARARALQRAPRALPELAPRTTSRSCNLTTPAQIFHACAARCCGRGASRWSS